jgi:hypothetical protein
MYSAGTISWLPPKQKIPSEHLATTNGIDEGYFGHPVLILVIDSAQKEAAVLIVRVMFDKPCIQPDEFADHIFRRQESPRKISTRTGQEDARGAYSHSS